MKQYTLDEAKHELAVRKCTVHGHGWDVISTMGNGPVALICSCCGEQRKVEPKVSSFTEALALLREARDRGNALVPWAEDRGSRRYVDVVVEQWQQTVTRLDAVLGDEK